MDVPLPVRDAIAESEAFLGVLGIRSRMVSRLWGKYSFEDVRPTSCFGWDSGGVPVSDSLVLSMAMVKSRPLF